MTFRRLILAVLIASGLVAAACSSSLYRVRPIAQLPPLPTNVRTAMVGGVTVRVAPLLTDEETQDLFEANLPLSGVLAVRLELAFESGVAVETKRVRFRLRDGEGRVWKQISPKSAVSRILKANEVYAYNPNSRKQFEKEFAAYGIDLESPLSSSDRRHQGFIFFQSPKGEPVASSTGFILTIERLPEPVEIRLN